MNESIHWRTINSAGTFLSGRTTGLTINCTWLEDIRHWHIAIRVTEYRLDPAARKRRAAVPLAHALFRASPIAATVPQDQAARQVAFRERREEALSEAKKWAGKTARVLEGNRGNFHPEIVNDKRGTA